jgi:hypothetical protein
MTSSGSLLRDFGPGLALALPDRGPGPGPGLAQALACFLFQP